MSKETIKTDNAAPEKGAAKAAAAIEAAEKKAAAKEAAAIEAAEKKAEKKTVVENPTELRQKAAKEAQLAAKKIIEANAKKQLERDDEAKSTAEKTSGKEVKDTRPTFEDERGLKFRFKKSAPKTLNIDGQSRLVTDLIKEPEVMLELINGNSNQIEQIH